MNHERRLSDSELRAAIETSIAHGKSLTATQYDMRADGWHCGPKRLRRMWIEAGGHVRPYVRG